MIASSVVRRSRLPFSRNVKREAGENAGQGEGGQGDRDEVEAMEVIDDEQRHGDECTQGGNGEQLTGILSQSTVCGA